MTTNLYREDGVNVVAGDDFSALAGEVCRTTFGNSPFVEVCEFSGGHFRGPRAFCIRNLPDDYALDTAPDGIGTKVVAIDAAVGHWDACRDVIAMTGGDITRWGGKPLVFVNILDVSTLGEDGSETREAFREMIRGLGQVANEQGIVCFRGETAELGACVDSENPRAMAKFNWGGVMLGVYLPDRMITGETLAPGQVVVALQEHGFRSNGLSSARAALRARFGENWWDNDDSHNAVREIARPSTLYDRFLADINGWAHPLTKPKVRPHLITHVTGGGIVGKFAEDMLFPQGLSARLIDLFEPPRIMRQVAEWREMSEEECYRTFNCGNGALVVLDRPEVRSFVMMAKQYGLNARPCGSIGRETSPALSIMSKFSGTLLEYIPK